MPSAQPPRILGVVLAVAAAIGVIANLLAQASRASAEPYVGFSELALSAAVGVIYAVAAATAALNHRSMLAVVALVGSCAQAAGAFAIGLEQRSSFWVPLHAVAPATEAAAIWLALAFPAGRIRGRAGLVAVIGAVTAASAVAAARVVFEDPSSWSWCSCAVNPVAVPLAPESYLTIERVAAVLWAVVGILAVAAVVAHWRGRGRRHQFLPDIVMSAALLLLVATSILAAVSRLLGLGEGGTALTFVHLSALAAIPAIVTMTMISFRSGRGQVADLLLGAREGRDTSTLRRLIARALGDPEAEVFWWDRDAGSYRDTGGELADDPRSDADGLTVLAVETPDVPIALVLLDPSLEASPELLSSITEALRLAAENRRLTEDLERSLAQVRESRARIVQAGDEARRRIERDLHDGAQQLLVSAGMNLRAASAQADAARDPQLATALETASSQLGDALAELRELATGLAPTALAHGSLADAIRELALRSTVPTTVTVTGSGLPSESVGSTIYFVAAEALTNAAKHAHASSARIELELGEISRVTIVDDGVGGADVTTGSGLRGLVDRVEAVGGRLDLSTGPTGTSVIATLPTHAGDRGEGRTNV